MVRAIWIILAIIGWSFGTQAQTGTLTGKVTHAKSGEPIIGVTVLLKVKDSLLSAVTNRNGRYRIRGLPADTYNVKVRGVRYVNTTLKGVVINKEAVTTKHVVLTSRSNTFNCFPQH